MLFGQKKRKLIMSEASLPNELARELLSEFRERETKISLQA
jgi:hypothetical protein